MTKKIGIKKTEIGVSDEYISKIGNIYSNIKNITIEGTLKKYKTLEFKNTIIVIMAISDDTGELTAVILGEREPEFQALVTTINIDSAYRLKGKVTIPDINDEDYIRELKEFSKFIDISDFSTTKILGIKAIEKIS